MAEPDAGDRLSHVRPPPVCACAVQLNAPPPALRMRRDCAGGLAAPVCASKVRFAGSTARRAVGAAVTVKATETVTARGVAPGAEISMVPG